MQNMLDICGSCAVDFDVNFNCVKSVAMTIGTRHYVCAELILCGTPLTYVSSIKYVGTCIISARTFTCTYEHVKLKFYRAFIYFILYTVYFIQS